MINSNLLILVFCIAIFSNNVNIWNQSYGDQAHTAYVNTEVTFPLEIIWKKNVVHGEISGSPVLKDDKLIILTSQNIPEGKNSLFCYNVDKNGLSLHWSTSLFDTAQGISPVIIGDSVICSSSQSLQCFDLETGSDVWEIKFTDTTCLSPTVLPDSNRVIVPTLNGHLYLIDALKGNIIWAKDNLFNNEYHFYPLVTASDDKLFVYYKQKNEKGIVAFDLSGDLLWIKKGEIIHTYVDDNAYVTLFNEGILFALHNPKTLWALDGDSGKIIWEYHGNGLLDVLSSDDKNVYIYSKMIEGVISIDMQTGKEVWKSQFIFPGESESEIIIDKSILSIKNCIFICHRSFDIKSGRIFGLDKENGSIIWKSEEISNIKGPLIFYHGLLIVKSGTLLIAFSETWDNSEFVSNRFLVQLFAILILLGIIIGIFFYIRIKKPKEKVDHA